MDRQKDSMVLKGMSSVHSGLSILLGVGRISANTHEQILALLNDDDKESNTSSGTKNNVTNLKKPNQTSWRDKDGPDSAVSLIDLQHGLGNMTMSDRPSKSFKKSGSLNSAAWPSNNNNNNNGGRTPDGEAWSSSRRSDIVCPWFLTPGCRCREQEKGQCAWIHEDVSDGIKDPLICSFWAENRCIKDDANCRFAHYWAQRRQIVSAPGAKYKKGPKKSFSGDDDAW
ncbi:hypothetical protein PG997_014237 [Apiospora hydei]|uniref:C3H1-type domain-containing protein n=1 Tax=Apiospora hydei TaxID=1337664 RepID=A0ABR1UT82_9PEZI